MQNSVSYAYRPRPLMSGGFVTLSVVLTIFMLVQAMHNYQGLIIGHCIHLSVTEATNFFWAFSGLMLFLVVLSVLALLKSFKGAQKIILDEYQLRSPKSLISNHIVAIPYQDIQQLMVEKNMFVDILFIKHKHGRLTITSYALTNNQEFENLIDSIEEKILAPEQLEQQLTDTPTTRHLQRKLRLYIAHFSAVYTILGVAVLWALHLNPSLQPGIVFAAIAIACFYTGTN